jgi:hypothetical protein
VNPYAPQVIEGYIAIGDSNRKQSVFFLSAGCSERGETYAASDTMVCTEGTPLQLHCAARHRRDNITAADRHCRGVQRVLDAPCESLAAVSFLQQVILDIGLMGGHESTDTLRLMYGPHYQSAYRSNTKDGMWQDPAQFAATLVAAGKALANSDTDGGTSRYVEIGVYTGWTAAITAAYVRRMTGRASRFEGFAVDITQGHITNATFETLTSLGVSFHKPGDFERSTRAWSAEVARTGGAQASLCFIDGDHSYTGVRKDYVRLAPLCRFVMLHDIMDARILSHNKRTGGGVPGFWATIGASERTNSTRYRQFVMRSGSGLFFGLGLVSPPPERSGSAVERLLDDPAKAPIWLRREGAPSHSSILNERLCAIHSPLCVAKRLTPTATSRDVVAVAEMEKDNERSGTTT